MCVSLSPASFGSTLVYGHSTIFRGRRVHVLGYQNNAQNRAPGPNAMILPIPASAPMGPDNAIDTRGFASVLTDYAERLRWPGGRPRGGPPAPAANGGVQVFERGSYTIVLARDASADAITAAVSALPERKRPPIDRAMFDAYLRGYPGWHLAICCFEGKVAAEPMLWWYEPISPEWLFLPGLDAHDGRVPQLDAIVSLDHTLIVGVDGELGIPLKRSLDVPDAVRPLLATRIAGWADLTGRCPNGDWWLRPDMVAIYGRPIAGQQRIDDEQVELRTHGRWRRVDAAQPLEHLPAGLEVDPMVRRRPPGADVRA